MSVFRDPAGYDAWYATERGSWIGKTEYRLLGELLDLRPGETLLDVGCGTGYFTRRFSVDVSWSVGADINFAALRFAAQRGGSYLAADARSLPFPDKSFDVVVSITALCFMAEPERAVAEMARVARRHIALGLLNRRSLLYFAKGRGDDQGAYQGARWHTTAEAIALFAGISVPVLRTAVFLPSGGSVARWVEPGLQRHRSDWGAFIAVAADVGSDSGLTEPASRSLGIFCDGSTQEGES